LDVGLQDNDISTLFLAEGLLLKAMPLLHPSGFSEALSSAITALPNSSRAGQARLAPSALMLYNRYSIFNRRFAEL